jgi:tetratricopeptide (TPR) repeat protein
MTPSCEEVDRFADGEMDPEEAEAFRGHVATCARCQADLDQLAQLHVLETRYRSALQAGALAPAAAPVPAAAPAPVTPIRAHPRWRWAAAGAASALAAALLLWTLSRTLLDRPPDSLWYPGGTHRLAEGRSAHPRAREHRPPAQGLLGPQGAGALSHDALGKLERAGDVLGVAAARLARGTARDAEEALEQLQELAEPDRNADVFSELAFAHLVRGDPTQGDSQAALRLADQALALDPTHAPALWNRALALDALGLDLVAARTFDAVAARGEPRWQDEARARAGELRRSTEEVRKGWEAALEAGDELVKTGAFPSPDLLSEAPVLRHYFYDAVRSATSSEEVLRLLPLAQQMDAQAGDTALADYVRATAGRSFTIRGPLAAEYRRLATGKAPEDAVQILRRLRASGEADLLLGALAKLEGAERSADELDRLARATAADAWLSTLALKMKAEALADAGRAAEARSALEEALRRCREARIDRRCAEVELALTYHFVRSVDLERAQAHARRGWEIAVRSREWGRQVQFIVELAQVARQHDDFPLARAYYEEALERTGERGNAERRRYAHEGLAVLDVNALRFDDARRHIDAAIATGRPLGLPGAMALADIARVKPSPERDRSAMQAFETRLPGFGAGERALARHVLGRWTLELDREQGLALLREAIFLATKDGLAARDGDARRALGYSYTSLILDAGKRGDAEGALRLFEEEWLAGTPGALPARCLLAVTVDSERTLVVVRGGGGGPAVAFYDSGRTAPLPRRLNGLVPAEAVKALDGCPQVDVLARAPVYGRPGLLPGDVAWSYRGAVPGQAPAPAGLRRHLVVQEVAMSPSRLPLRTPAAWRVPEVDGERLEQLRRADATPSEVLRRMEDATDITFIAHALVHPDSGEAYLVLAPEPGAAGGAGLASDALRASDLQSSGLRLKGRPLVVLASCEGAQPAPVLHEPRSLPAAFLRAGARAVLAASDPVQQQDGPEFFAGVRARVRAGASPAEALRAERAAWLAQGRGKGWVEGVLLFE